MGKVKDLTDMRFGRLTALYIDNNISGKGKIFWRCKCDCGNYKSILSTSLTRKRNGTKSCGCLHREIISKTMKEIRPKHNIYDLESYEYGLCYDEDMTHCWKFDKEDYELINKYYWNSIRGYASSRDTENNCTLQMHRLVMKCEKFDGKHVDHINHDTYDNRKYNLRTCTKFQNSANQKPRKDNTSGCTGVVLDKRTNKWVAQIIINRKHIHLGVFVEKEDAIKARKEAEEKYYGEFSYDNSLDMIYLNTASTTQPAQEVIDDVTFYLKQNWSNPSDISQDGIHAKSDITYARNQIGKAIGASCDEIFFVSSGSEANNWVLKGVLDAYPEIDTIITSTIEHPSIYNTCKYLETKGYTVHYLDVNCYGQVSIYKLKQLIKDYNIKRPLVSIMFANNEIGSINPIKEISKIVKSIDGIFHCDAVQAFMHTYIDVKELGIDFISASAHKVNACKGTGFLYKRKDLNITPLIHGGKQELGSRGGTENVPYICAFGNQVERLSDDLDVYLERAVDIHNYIIQEVYEKCGEYCDVHLNGHPTKRIANNLSFTFEGINAEQLITLLDMKGVVCSMGSACCSGEKTPSRVLKSIGLSNEEAFSTIRVSFDYNTTREMIDEFVDALVECIRSLQMFG